MSGTVKKYQFAEGTSVGSPTDLGIATSTSAIEDYADDATYVSNEGTAVGGSIYANTSSNKVRVFVSGAWRSAILEPDSAGALTLGGNVGANNLTLGGTSSTVVVPGSLTSSGQLLLQNTTGSQPTLALSEDPDNGTNKVVLQAPATLAADYTLTLPVDDGDNGEALTTNGSGVLSWEPVLTNPMTTRGDIIRGGVSGAPERLAAVTDNRVVRGDGTDVISGQIDDPDFFTTGAAAGASSIGIVTTGSQTIAGLKNFSTGITLPTSGGTASTLDFYEESSFNLVFDVGMETGANTAAAVVRRIGKIVIMEVAQLLTTAGVTTTDWETNSNELPTRFRPASDISLSVRTVNNAVTDSTSSILTITSTGNVGMRRSANWTSGTANCGFRRFSASWTIA